MHALVAGGADVIELGVPFSDPMADGPVIQRSSERALKHGVSLKHVIGYVAEFRKTNATTAGGAVRLRESGRSDGHGALRRRGESRGRRWRADRRLSARRGRGDRRPARCAGPRHDIPAVADDDRGAPAARGRARTRLSLLRVAERRDRRGEHRPRRRLQQDSPDIRRHTRLPRRRGFRHPRRRNRAAHRRRRGRGGDRQPPGAGDRGFAAGRRERPRDGVPARRARGHGPDRDRDHLHELAPEAPSAEDQARFRRAPRKRSRKGCGANANRARRCSTAPTSRRTSTSARSAATTTASPRASASITCSTAKAATRSAPKCCRSTR